MRLMAWMTSCAVLLTFLAFTSATAETQVNSLKEVSVQTEGDRSVVHIVTDQSVGYRYTVYDSNDPIRVVVDFPRMNLGDLESTIKVSESPLTEIRLSTFDLSLGTLARVELLLEKEAEYRVNFADNDMQISFATERGGTAVAAEQVAAEEPAPVKMEAQDTEAEKDATTEVAAEPKPTVGTAADQSVAETSPQKAVGKMSGQNPVDVTVNDGKVELSAAEKIDQVRYFTLETPKRLVVDLYGVTPGEIKSYALHSGFDRMRIGPYENKTRYVFDVSGNTFPQFAVSDEERTVTIAWSHSGGTKPAPQKIATTTAKVNVTDINFNKDDGTSKLVIELDGPVQPRSIDSAGDKVQFALPNTTIPRALRRVFDSLAFPSAIHSAIPYLVAVGGSTEVRFSVQLKGDVESSLTTSGNDVVLTVTDGRFTEAQPLDGEAVLVPMSGADTAVASAPEVTGKAVQPQAAVQPVVQPATPVAEPKVVEGRKETKVYTGETISLVFDNANVKNILQLIAEVSDQNIIASDEVKGSVTLRLIDVPWDQALELVLDITGLGMIQEGNVVRVMPKETIRAKKNAELTAVTTAEKLEPLETEIVPVNYADLGSVSGPAQDLLSDRGKITNDQRNKALVITDVPSRIEKIKELVQLLDTPERQVMIEARIVEVNSSYSQDLGVNWGLSDENDRAGGNSDRTLDVGAGGSFLIGLPAAGGVATTPGLGAGMTFGDVLVDNTVLSMRISALEAAGNAKVVSTPRVTTLNGETALISQGTTIPYQSSGDDGLPKTEFVNAELKLEVTPVINPDGSVILEILATNDSPSLTGGTSDAPQIDTKKAETKVMVKDGHTTVIGGIFVENDSQSNSGVPLLKEIPILGNLFKSKAKANTKAELMIFITPRILQGQ